MPVVTSTPIQLSYFVADIAAAMATYNRLRWHRSRTGQDGLYEPATAAAAAAAALVGSLTSPHQVNGKTLSFRVNGVTTVNVLFSNPDPVTTAQVVSAINGATALVVASDDGTGKVRITTVATGSGASIEILESTAAPFLGFAVGAAAVGLDVNTTLVGGTHEYFYTDQNSDEDFWYRVEFINSSTGATSGLGVPFKADQPDSIPKSKTIVCFIRLSDLAGLPIGGRVITFFNPFMPNTVEVQQQEVVRWGVVRHYAQMTTGRNGYAEIRLIRGMKVDFAVDGTDFIRRIQIPTTGDLVDLLDPTLVVEDEFGIQQPKIDFAVRTS